MSDRTSLETVKAGYECFAKKDIPGLLELFANDIEWKLPEISGVPHAGVRRGIEAMGEFFRLLDEAEDITAFEPGEFITEGDRVVVLGSIKATVRATGRDYASDWVHVFRVADGKVKSFNEFFDSAAVERAFQKAAIA